MGTAVGCFLFFVFVATVTAIYETVEYIWKKLK